MAFTNFLAPRRRGLRRRSELLSPLEQEMNRLFEDFWLTPFGAAERWGGAYLPAVNVREHDNHVIVTAELPGMKEDDIEVSVRGDSLRISGEKKEETETKEEDFYRMESSYGRFDRLIDLPAEVDEQKAEAEFKNGVLTIKLQKNEESTTKTKKIPIKAG